MSPTRIDLDPEDVGRGLGQLVVVILEVVRELLERQAIRRMEAGDLTAEQVERLGNGLRDVAEQLSELGAMFAPEPDRESRVWRQ